MVALPKTPSYRLKFITDQWRFLDNFDNCGYLYKKKAKKFLYQQ